jgi:hypothetical protein
MLTRITLVKRLLWIWLVTVSGLSPICVAQVQLPTVNLGLTNFEDGFAAPGWILQEFPDFFDASQLKNSEGRTVPGTNHLISVSTTSHLVYVGEQRVAGGWLAFEVLQPWVHLHADFGNGPPSTVRGFADLTAGGGVQWAPIPVGGGVFASRLMLDVTAPTGRYDDRQPVNLGNHFVAVNPYYALTYEIRKFEVSARLHYLWNSTNHDPFVGFGDHSVQAGQAFHMNYSASYEIVHNVRVGFNGYWLQQFTEDKANDIALPHSLERTVGLGAGIQVLAGRMSWFHLNGYKETDVRNRPQGFSVTFRYTKAFPSSPPHL